MPFDSKAWAGVAAALEPLGRVALLLDGDMRVIAATETLNAMVCDEASRRIIGRPIADLLGKDLFHETGAVMAGLDNGHRQEGRRGFIQCGAEGARLVSMSIARLDTNGAPPFGDNAAYIVVLRPAEAAALDLQSATSDLGIVTRSHRMLEVVRIIELMCRSDATVLITGESGVGKEVVARAIHARSPRHEGAFVGVNCAALPGGLLESELFGHVKGAFTGAHSDRVGRMELAANGTLFLDEIGDMPVSLQAKLLRVLQEHEYERLGESKPRTFTARVIAATNVDIDEAVESGQLRKDLYYRLRVVPIHIPPLRERMEDVEPLARLLLERIGRRAGRALRLSPEALRQLSGYDWPGNVRELENKLEYATALCKGQTVTVEHLPDLGPVEPEPAVTCSVAAVPALTAASKEVAEEADEAARIREALEANHWRRADAANALNMSRTTLWRRMQALGVE